MLTCIVVMTIITAIYSCAGGVRSVVWNDCIQFAVYMAGAIATVWIIVTHLPGGWSQLVEFGHDDRPLATVRFRSVADQSRASRSGRDCSAARFCRWPRMASTR